MQTECISLKTPGRKTEPVLIVLWPYNLSDGYAVQEHMYLRRRNHEILYFLL